MFNNIKDVIKIFRRERPITGNSPDVCGMLWHLGIDPSKTRSAHLKMDAGELVTMDVEYIVSDRELRKLKQFFGQQYKLVKLD